MDKDGLNVEGIPSQTTAILDSALVHPCWSDCSLAVTFPHGLAPQPQGKLANCGSLYFTETLEILPIITRSKGVWSVIKPLPHNIYKRTRK